MPGPFPGMDPYLESRVLWRGVHQGLIFALNQQLNASLPPGFSANMEERVYIAGPDLGVYPDVVIREETPDTSSSRSGGGVAVQPATEAQSASMPRHITVYPARMREPYIEIFHQETESVVAVIEVLSPANKANGAGREEYLRKQRSLCASATHLLEIDLLRGGAYTVAVPEQSLRQRGERWDYIVSLHFGKTADATEGQEFDYWPIPLRERLPLVRVPLTPDHAHTPLDLQIAFDQMYDAGPYRRRIRYDDDLELPLASEDADWARALIQAWSAK